MDAKLTKAVNRFKSSLISGNTFYFDVSEFEEIVDQLLEEGDLQASEIAARQGIQIHPGSFAMYLKYAQVLLNKGKYKKSLKYLQFAENVEVNNPDVHLLKGSARLVMGNERDAFDSFSKAIECAGNERDEIYYQIGTTYIQIGEIPKAIHYFEKTIEANPENEMALYDLGFFCDQAGKHELSIKYYNEYLDLNPYNHAVWFNLGTVLNKTDEHRKAIEAYEFALAIKDDFHMGLFNIGNALANLEQYEEAIGKYLEFLETEPENDDAHCYIAECYLNISDHDNAAYYYEKALELNKSNDIALFGLGLILWLEMEYEDSIDFISKAISLDEENSEYWLTLGKVYVDDDNQEHAMEAFKEAARLDAGNFEIWLAWSDLYNKIKEPLNAIRILKLGIRKNSNTLLKYHLVSFLLEMKNETEAFKWLAISLQEEFEQINYLFDIYPKALKNKKLQKIVADYRKNYITK